MPKGRTTYYRGFRFRSRIEAAWAAFFDGAKLEWFYEADPQPGYLPDFRLQLPGRPILVEVKHAFSIEELIAEAAPKLRRIEWSGEVLLCGARYDIRIGADIPLPPNTVPLWAEAWNETQWFPETKTQPSLSRPVIAVPEVATFRSQTKPTLTARTPAVPELGKPPERPRPQLSKPNPGVPEI